MPTGHAKRWVIGQPLPANLIIYELPPVIITQLGPPPSGHRYIRVDSDILLLAISTGMVIDACGASPGISHDASGARALLSSRDIAIV